jgi:hypothetical protein
VAQLAKGSNLIQGKFSVLGRNSSGDSKFNFADGMWLDQVTLPLEVVGCVLALSSSRIKKHLSGK